MPQRLTVRRLHGCLALTGAWVDVDRGLVSTIVLEMGGSSNICASFRPGDPVVLMGPIGDPTEIAPGEEQPAAAAAINMVLFSIGQAARARFEKSCISPARRRRTGSRPGRSNARRTRSSGAATPRRG